MKSLSSRTMLEGYKSCKVNLGRFSSSNIDGLISFLEESPIKSEEMVTVSVETKKSSKESTVIVCAYPSLRVQLH